ncbi:MAG: hypothetical protein ACYTHK_04410 [Planctomycetota bacterium]
MVCTLLLLLAAPAFESFDAPLDPQRWFIGAPNRPKKGRLGLPEGGFLAARGIEQLARLQVFFRGGLTITFHDPREPLTGAKSTLVIPRGKGDRVLVVTPDGARVDGEKVDWSGKPLGAFVLRGPAELDEVRVTPAPQPPPAPSKLERQTPFWLTTPQRHGDYRRVTLTLWDVPVCFLLRRGESAVAPLRGPRGPVLGWMVTVSDGRATSLKASAHELAMRDWGDERGNLGAREFKEYLAREYALFELLASAQRVLNASRPDRKLEPLVALAVIRHANSVRAALALAETNRQTAALRLIRAELPKGHVSSDQIRAAAGRAARKLLGDPPWEGFSFDPQDRYATLTEAREHLR